RRVAVVLVVVGGHVVVLGERVVPRRARLRDAGRILGRVVLRLLGLLVQLQPVPLVLAVLEVVLGVLLVLLLHVVDRQRVRGEHGHQQGRDRRTDQRSHPEQPQLAHRPALGEDRPGGSPRRVQRTTG